jgi:glycosyltransferase involved in cell wall biosynthesis
MELTVIIPSRDRKEVLLETLAGLEDQALDGRFEVVVVDDGSSDGTVEAVRSRVAGSSLEIQLVEQAALGPAAARNRALEVARAPVCLFLNDDSRPRPGLLARHRDFHARSPAAEAALLGSIALPPHPAPTPFMRFLAEVQFDYAAIADPADVGGRRFYTANVSAKTEFVRASGGFDERYRSAAHEDIDLGLRLEQRGMRLAYDRDAVIEHLHPMDLRSALDRLWRVGQALAAFAEQHPEWEVASRPGVRHRVKAAALTALATLGFRAPRLQREIWRFLCHEAAREGYWSALDGRQTHRRRPDGVPRIGRRLADLASSDQDAQAPRGG